MDKLRIRQAVVVEGKYDQNALRQLVDTAIFTTNGFTGMKDPALLRLLRQAAETTGLIILTDSDGAGFLIRNTLKSALPAEGVLHAYIPDIPGKERRKRQPGKEGKLGVEGMTPRVLEQVLRQPLAYVGFMGSRRKIATARERMLEAGIPESALDAVHMPIGLDIKAETPEEIAGSIAAECILHRATC